jgi:hypothetical protein
MYLSRSGEILRKHRVKIWVKAMIAKIERRSLI